MSGTKYLLDTCFLLGLYKRNSDILDKIARYSISLEQCMISRINRIEVLGYTKLSQNDEQGLTQLLANFTCLPICDAVEQETIAIRKQHRIKLPDAIILATANVHHLNLLTLDKRLQNKQGEKP